MENIESISKLSPVQEGMLFHTIYEPEKEYYIVQKIVDFQGDLDVDALKESIYAVHEKYDVLRSTFEWDELSEPLRITHKKFNVSWTDYPLNEDCKSNIRLENKIEEILRNNISGVLDLSKEPPLKWALIYLNDCKYKLVFTHHHIILDGWSLELLFEEIMKNYNLLIKGFSINKIKAESFNEYVDWLYQKNLLEEEFFWKENLRGFESPTPVKLFHNHETKESYKTRVSSIKLNKELVETIVNASRKNQLSINTILQGAWGLLLHNYTSANEVIFGSTFSGRTAELEGSENRIGMFINTLPVRVNFKKQKTIDYLKDFQMLSNGIQQHQNLSPILIKQLSGIKQKEVIFNTIFVFEKYTKSTKENWQGLTIINKETRESSHYPLSLIVTPDKNENWQVNIKHDEFYLSNKNAQRVLKHYQTLILSIINNLDNNLMECSYMSQKELLFITNDLSRGEESSRELKHFNQIFKENVYKNPNSISAVDGNSKYTYQDLFNKANTIAASLIEKGVKFGDVIGIYMDREVNLLSSILATWKLGASFVPIDTMLGKERISYIVKDAQINTLLIGSDNLSDDLSDLNINIYFTNELILNDSSQNIEDEEITLQNIAYIIYTSGSTGQPKGVMVSHENLSNYIQHAVSEYMNGGEGAILHSSIGFDLTLTSLLVPLAQEKTVFICSSKEKNNLSKQINTTKVGFTKLTPSHLKMLEYELDIKEASSYCDKWILGGEALTYETIKPWLEASSSNTFINEYGPTEATIGCTTFEVNKEYNDRQDGIVPIGKPIKNTQVYILNDLMRPVPIGVLGEIYIAGKGVAKGYLNKPTLTKEKFLDNPFSSNEEKIYKTGDIGFYLDNGDMVYVGRNDDQIKVRGYRIEPKEIEKILIEFAKVNEAKVISSKDNLNSERLVAYIVDVNSDNTPKNYKSILRNHLPEYLVPDKIIQLDFLPLTLNLKVDIKKLPEPNWSNLDSDMAPPTTELEKNILKVWTSILDIESIGINDDFFDIGGHSLLAIKVIATLRAKFNISLLVSDIFKYSTIFKLSLYIKTLTQKELSDKETLGIKPVRKQRIKQ